MIVNVCLASRGRPYLLNRALLHADRLVADPARVVFAVALDADDATVIDPPKLRSGLVWNIAPREDTLGAKYNRCARLAPDADLFLSMSDDMLLDTRGWDDICRESGTQFLDGAGVVYCGKDPKSDLPGHILATRFYLDLAGEFFCEHFPYWFLDPWFHEVAMMAGRLADCPRGFMSRPIAGRAGKTRGLRDLVFWQGFYRATRYLRVAQADGIVRALYGPRHPLRLKIDALRQTMIDGFHRSDEFLLDPAKAAEVTAAYAEDAPADARYLRIKARAEHLIAAPIAA